jgi:hypothetical protein
MLLFLEFRLFFTISSPRLEAFVKNPFVLILEKEQSACHQSQVRFFEYQGRLSGSIGLNGTSIADIGRIA